MNEIYRYGLEGLDKENGDKVSTDEQLTDEDPFLPKTEESQNNVNVMEILDSFSTEYQNLPEASREKSDDINEILDGGASTNVDTTADSDVTVIMNDYDKDLRLKNARQEVERTFKTI